MGKPAEKQSLILRSLNMVADEAFLVHRGDELSVLGEDLPVIQSFGPAGAGTLDNVQKPLVHSKIPVEPQGVIQAGDLYI